MATEVNGNAGRYAATSLLRDLPEGVLIIAAREHRIVLANEAACQILDMPLKGRLARRLPIEFRTTEGEPVSDGDHPLLAAFEGHVARGREYQVTLPGRRTLTLLVNTAAIASRAGRVVRAMVVFQDVTARWAAQRSRDDALAIAGHELRTPLSSLKGWVEYTSLLVSRGSAAELQAALANVDRQVGRMEALIDELLESARMDGEPVELEQSEFDLTAVVGGVIAGLAPEHAQRIIFRRRRPIEVYGDKSRLERVVLNLLTNALKFSPAGGSVRAVVLRRPGGVFVGVRDRGIGIPAVELPHVCERFYRAFNSPRGSGLGLGLYIASEILRSHGTQLRVQSEEGSGTTFGFSLPFHRAVTADFYRATRHSKADVQEAYPGLPAA